MVSRDRRKKNRTSEEALHQKAGDILKQRKTQLVHTVLRIRMGPYTTFTQTDESKQDK